MSKIDDGGAAFPYADGVYANGQKAHGSSGMTLRDYFAAAALQGLLASGHFTHDGHEYSDSGPWMTCHEDPYDDETGEEIHKGRMRFDFPEAAWKCADRMLAARKEARP